MPGRLSESYPRTTEERRWAMLVQRIEQTVSRLQDAIDSETWVLPSSLGALPLGTLVGYDGGWVLASSDDAQRRALGIVSGSDSRGTLASAKRGKFRWPSHGLGSTGQIFWLGIGGATATAPEGLSARIVQRLGIVLDANYVLMEWNTPEYES